MILRQSKEMSSAIQGQDPIEMAKSECIIKDHLSQGKASGDIDKKLEKNESINQ